MKTNLSIAWLLSYISIASVSAAIITPALPLIQSQFGLSLGNVQWIVSSFLMGYVLGQLLYGPLANAYGRLTSLRLGLTINIIGLLLCLLACHYNHFGFLVMGRFVTGIGAAAGLACTFMLINEWLPENSRKTAMAYAILSFALGIGLAVMIGGLITEYSHWQYCFWFLIAQGLLMRWGLCVFSETLTTPKPIQMKALCQDYLKALSSMKLVVFSMLVGSCSMIGYCFSAAGPQIAHHYLHLTMAHYGYWNSINIIGMLLGGLSSRELLQRLSISQVIAIGFLGCSAGVISLIILWQLDSHCVSWFFINTAGIYLFSSYLFAGGSYIASNALDDKASGSSMMSFVNMSFATLCVIIMGYLSDNPLIAFITIMTVVFISMFVLIQFTMRRYSIKTSHLLSK